MVLCSFFGIAGMAVLVGIDEAGFGPILGPLVVSSSTFSLPHHLLTSDLWQVLKKSVGDKRKRLAGRLLIADSKKVYSKSLGIKHLERTVLGCLRCIDKEPGTLTELVELLCPNCLEQLSDYPWYKDAGPYRLSADSADRAIASSVLAADLSSNGIELLELKSYCLEVAYYNRMVSTVKNKASVLFTATSILIKNAFDNFARQQQDDLQIIIDRQGGRVRYRKALQLMFPDMELKILRESPSASSYELAADGKRMRLHFVVGADEQFLPVSLASMVGKYLRELLIGSMNRYFAGFHPGLRPTAGYWKDGLRFIEDLKTYLPNLQIDSNQLIRCR
jgi:ribonuclease HII